MGLLNAKRRVPNVPKTNARKLPIERPLVILSANEPTWARTWSLPLKSQKIRTSYEMGWLEKETDQLRMEETWWVNMFYY